MKTTYWCRSKDCTLREKPIITEYRVSGMVCEYCGATMQLCPLNFALIEMTKEHEATLILSASGDRTAGGSLYAEVKLWVGTDPEYIAYLWKALRDTFQIIWDEKPVVAYWDVPVCDAQNHEVEEDFLNCAICQDRAIEAQMIELEALTR